MIPKPAFLALLCPLALAAATGPLAPAGLRCEYMKDPLGVDVAQPRFYWNLIHTERAQKQSAYQIVVDKVWDSGKVASADSVHVVYAGPALKSDATYRWKVRYWDKDGKESPWSATARFDTGLLAASDWKAKWIGGGNQLRKGFQLAARPVRARAYVSGLGYYELRLNGAKVGDHVLDPGWTTWHKRVLYSAYDVTAQLHQGANAVGLMLGNGWFKNRIGLLQLSIDLADGSHVDVVSDASWRATDGAITGDSLYNGETYDARRETPGWDTAAYKETEWRDAKLVEAPKGVLSAQLMPPIRVTGDLYPLKITSPKPGMFVYDMGQNFSGLVRLKVKGPRGAAVRIRHAELLYDDGTLNVENLRAARATDTYILRGDGEEEVYQPRFTYHGFRYVEITGYPGVPKLDSVMGKIVHSDVAPTGGFSCSKPILNQLQRIIVWGIQSNLESVPTDCNQRDERMGWMADAHLYAESAMMNYDMPALYSNFVRNIRDNQETHPDGSVSDTVPHERFVSGPADPAWGSAYPLFVWYLYERYGDRRILEENFDGIKKWADSLKAKSEGNILNFYKYADWVPVERTPGNLVSTFYYCWSVDIVAQAADVLGKGAVAAEYKQLGQDIRAAFHKRFYNAEGNFYGNGSQTSQVLPLFLDMVPKEGGRSMGYLRDDIVYMKNTHLYTGIVGTKYAMPLLARRASDLAYDLAVQTEYPSWGYMMEHGATTLWELWQQKTGPSMNSHNHPMFGGVGTYLYESLAGINYDPKDPGYRHIAIRPGVVRDLKWAAGSIETVRGTVSSSWKRGDGTLTVDVDIPVGSDAEVLLPRLGMDGLEVLEAGQPVWQKGAFAAGVAGVTAAAESKEGVVVRCGSGRYSFELRGR
jgi:alpha-L-rhamnosidase